jgi:hypothetical protein
MAEYSPEKAGVGGSIPSLATILSIKMIRFAAPRVSQQSRAIRIKNGIYGR